MAEVPYLEVLVQDVALLAARGLVWGCCPLPGGLHTVPAAGLGFGSRALLPSPKLWGKSFPHN